MTTPVLHALTNALESLNNEGHIIGVRTDVLAELLVAKLRENAFEICARPPVKGTTVGNLRIDDVVSTIFWKNIEVPLTIKMYHVVKALAEERGRYVTYETLYAIMWKLKHPAGRDQSCINIRCVIRRIRAKFQSIDPTFDAIDTKSGVGYRWYDWRDD